MRLPSLLHAGALVAGLSLAPGAALAQQSRALFGLDAEAFGTRPLDRFNQDLFGLGVGGALHLELNAHPLLGLHVGGAGLYLADQQSAEPSAWLGGRAGLRFHWGVLAGASSSDGWLDVHWDFGQSGGVSRSGVDVGLGYAFAVTRGLRFGPFARYQWASDPRGEDPHLVHVGLTVGLLGDPRFVAGRDHDHDGDGVEDRDDECPTEPAGAHPDPRRRGCAARDGDGDGVMDAQDQCPGLAAGARPDPARPGCPVGDADSDGVPDGLDACPTVPEGAHGDPARHGCPASDTDNDGAFDHEDQCPTVPAGFRPDPARRGCPAPDRDGDSIPDADDRCPDQVGAPSRDPARHGCPGLVRIEQHQIRILRPVFFATNRDVILEASFPVLTAVADAIVVSGIQRVRVEGHSDNRGVAARNLALSQRRADSVRRWLGEHGVEPSRLESVGLGQTRPVETNRTALGRAANRRVEFHILDVAPAQ